MVSKCANPTCSSLFHYFGEGTVFEIRPLETSQQHSPEVAGRSRKSIEHFWLCSACSSTLTLAVDPGRNVQVVPRWKTTRSRPARAIAS